MIAKLQVHPSSNKAKQSVKYNREGGETISTTATLLD